MCCCISLERVASNSKYFKTVQGQALLSSKTVQMCFKIIKYLTLLHLVFFIPGGSFPSLLRHCAVVKEMVIVLGTRVNYGKLHNICDYNGVY
jgi:hypothetical protein